MARAKLVREDRELKKFTVREYIHLKTGMEPYLRAVLSPHQRFLLTQFRLNVLHWLFAEPGGHHNVESLGLCLCDKFSVQDTIRFLFVIPIVL